MIVDPSGDTRPSPPPPPPGQPTIPRYRLTPLLLGSQARFGAAGSSALRRTGKARYRSTANKYQVARDGWTVASTDDLTRLLRGRVARDMPRPTPRDDAGIPPRPCSP